ncbi:hypothetical protein CEXT_130651 [Caerostris extrusa]|uniref:Uncharacterized protein n=1 Tax=Caerostris extrusa TaxID=172846 RepID=A0AAV4XHX5_CAEEX|nr:hypothetical protein CEXT_130651 [Caerostris extrusa]
MCKPRISNVKNPYNNRITFNLSSSLPLKGNKWLFLLCCLVRACVCIVSTIEKGSFCECQKASCAVIEEILLHSSHKREAVVRLLNETTDARTGPFNEKIICLRVCNQFPASCFSFSFTEARLRKVYNGDISHGKKTDIFYLMADGEQNSCYNFFIAN